MLKYPHVHPKGTAMKLRFLLILSALLSTSFACQAATSILQGGEAIPDDVLYQDDFSDPSSGWDRVSTQDGVTDYEDGSYRILVNTTNTDIWANPDLDFDFTDTSISVDATAGGGDEDNDFGLICRYQDDDNFYFFVISSDGYYGIGKVSDNVQQLVGMESMPPSEVIRQGKLTNQLQADCIGSTLRLHVNGVLLAEVEDSEFTSGNVGLMAGSFATPGTDIHFDNFVVRKP
jgi:hypothetical protein